MNVTSFDNVCQVPLLVQDLNGPTNTHTYDGLCRPTRVDHPLSGTYEVSKYCDDSGMPACGNANAQYKRSESPSADGVSIQWDDRRGGSR